MPQGKQKKVSADMKFRNKNVRYDIPAHTGPLPSAGYMKEAHYEVTHRVIFSSILLLPGAGVPQRV
jgi:hypothetical protein